MLCFCYFLSSISFLLYLYNTWFTFLKSFQSSLLPCVWNTWMLILCYVINLKVISLSFIDFRVGSWSICVGDVLIDLFDLNPGLWHSLLKIFLSVFENCNSGTKSSWVLPEKPSWGCRVFSQPGFCLGVQSGAFSPPWGQMSRPKSQTWQRITAPLVSVRGCSQVFALIFNGWGPHPLLQDYSRSLPHMLHINQSRC